MINEDTEAKRNIMIKSEKKTLRLQTNNVKPITDLNVELSPQISPFHMQSKHFVSNKQGKRPYNEDRFVCKSGINKFYFTSHLKK